MRKKTLRSALIVFAFLVVVGFAWWFRTSRQTVGVIAATGGGEFSAASYLQASDGGMAQFGVRLQQSASPSETLQTLSDWNSYVVSRSEWGLGLTAPLLDRLATADWNARKAGSPQITAEQLATAVTNLINARLASMTAEQQVALFWAMMTELTPKGRLGLNQKEDYVSAVKQGDGRWTVTISSAAFAGGKATFSQWAPGMVSNSTNFYPGEAILVFYFLASGDTGFGGDFSSKVRKALTDLTGLDMANRYLYGERGYLVRRPLQTFLTEQAMGQLFGELGF